MAAIFRLFEGCLLVAMGTFMVTLSQSSLYWQFLNPKYSWLTLVSGIALAIIGFACLFNVQRQRKLSEFVGILVFLSLAATAVYSFDSMVETETIEGSLTTEYSANETPSVTIGGTEYVKINGAELMLAEQEGNVAAGQAYAVQGALIRSSELDQTGHVGVGRLLITCCFADSIGVVTLVKVTNPEAYSPGAWVRVLGVVEEGKSLPGQNIVLNGALTGVRSERFVLRADEVEERKVEGVPFIFEIRNEAPYAY